MYMTLPPKLKKQLFSTPNSEKAQQLWHAKSRCLGDEMHELLHCLFANSLQEFNLSCLGCFWVAASLVKHQLFA